MRKRGSGREAEVVPTVNQETRRVLCSARQENKVAKGREGVLGLRTEPQPLDFAAQGLGVGHQNPDSLDSPE